MQTGKGVVSGAEHCGHVREAAVANRCRGCHCCGLRGAGRERRRAEEEERLDAAKDDDLGKAAVSARRNIVVALRLDNELSHICPADVM